MGVGTCVHLDRDSISVHAPGADSDKSKSFRFDRTYGEASPQESVYRYGVVNLAFQIAVVLGVLCTNDAPALVAACRYSHAGAYDL